MSFFENNTPWAKSAKGNHWKKEGGVVLIVGGSSSKKYWVRVGENFLEDRYDSIEEAKSAAVKEAKNAE
jgi:hypothetical protein